MSTWASLLVELRNKRGVRKSFLTWLHFIFFEDDYGCESHVESGGEGQERVNCGMHDMPSLQ